MVLYLRVTNVYVLEIAARSVIFAALLLLQSLFNTLMRYIKKCFSVFICNKRIYLQLLVKYTNCIPVQRLQRMFNSTEHLWDHKTKIPLALSSHFLSTFQNFLNMQIFNFTITIRFISLLCYRASLCSDRTWPTNTLDTCIDVRSRWPQQESSQLLALKSLNH